MTTNDQSLFEMTDTLVKRISHELNDYRLSYYDGAIASKQYYARCNDIYIKYNLANVESMREKVENENEYQELVTLAEEIKSLAFGY